MTNLIYHVHDCIAWGLLNVSARILVSVTEERERSESRVFWVFANIVMIPTYYATNWLYHGNRAIFCLVNSVHKKDMQQRVYDMFLREVMPYQYPASAEDTQTAYGRFKQLLIMKIWHDEVETFIVSSYTNDAKKNFYLSWTQLAPHIEYIENFCKVNEVGEVFYRMCDSGEIDKLALASLRNACDDPNRQSSYAQIEDQATELAVDSQERFVSVGHDPTIEKDSPLFEVNLNERLMSMCSLYPVQVHVVRTICAEHHRGHTLMKLIQAEPDKVFP